METYLNISNMEYPIALDTLQVLSPDINHISIQIDFGVDYSQSKVIRDYIGWIFDSHCIHAPWRGRFILITDELVNNAIEHGSTLGDIDSCFLEVTRDPDGEFSIKLDVHDTGHGKDSKTGKDMVAVKMSHTEKLENEEKGVYMQKRGRGLFSITEKLVDNMSFYESPKGGLAVRIEKTISKDDPSLIGTPTGKQGVDNRTK